MSGPALQPPYFGMAGPPGAPTGERPPTPPVVTWFKVYAIFMAVVYAGVCVLGLAMLTMPGFLGSAHSDPGLLISGGVYAVLGLAFGIPFALAPFFRQSWAWVYDLVLICVGMTSCACWPATIPLLIYWLKPEVKQHFGR